MATIILNRTSEFVNYFRNYTIYIDGKKVGTIANGETKKLVVSSGQHSIVTKIDWASSKTLTFHISDNEIQNFEVGGFKNAKWFMPAALVVFILNCVANWIFGFEYLFYLLVPAFLLIVYYMTIGQKRYLTLSETETNRQARVAV